MNQTLPQQRRPTRPVQKRCALRDKEIQAIELAAQGLTQSQIGGQIGLTRSGVSKLLIRTERKLAELLKDRGEEIKAAQTAKLDYVYREAMQAWERSKNGATSTKSVCGGREDGRSETTTRDQNGDPRFLAEARAALSDVRKIWGLDESSQRDVQDMPVQIQVNFSDNFFGRTVIEADDIAVTGEPVLEGTPG